MQRCFVSPTTILLFALLPRIANAQTFDCRGGNVSCVVNALNQAAVAPARKTTIRVSGSYELTVVDNGTTELASNGLPSIVSDVTLDGGKDGAIFRRSVNAPTFRILHVSAPGHLTLNNLTVTNGTNPLGAGLRNDGGIVTIANSSFRNNLSGPAVQSVAGALDVTASVFADNAGLGRAGGIWMDGGDLRVDQSWFHNNSSIFGVGAVRLTGANAFISRTTFTRSDGNPTGSIQTETLSTLLVTDSAFVANVGSGPAGIFNVSGSVVTVVNTTLARNAGGFGATENGSTILNLSTMSLINSTFAENRGPLTEHFSVIGSGGTTVLQNTIVAHDPAFPGNDCRGVIFSLGNNLFGDPNACPATLHQTDRTGYEGLGALTDDGTAGNAHYPLLVNSQAIDATDGTACPKRDQLGNPRAARCDIGAIEFRQGRASR